MPLIWLYAPGGSTKVIIVLDFDFVKRVDKFISEVYTKPMAMLPTQSNQTQRKLKAAFKLVEIMESNRPIVQANNKLSAAQTLLDRVGVSKIDKLDVNHNLNSGIFVMPDKAPLDLPEEDYEDISDRD